MLEKWLLKQQKGMSDMDGNKIHKIIHYMIVLLLICCWGLMIVTDFMSCHETDKLNCQNSQFLTR